ncbi:histone-lysine N-methyltransferase SETMAR isoform X2 [Alosa alosa]|uniref:histone-lysine N-methyltransferase SETMAR isoform X2 n=1 Tax=Alosa alosa TaxID=278164 RepID=UPI002015402C|nr:histone-lysine N-methyltransferase SETMAR isoform X2 [Alosa alosa]
MASDSARDMTNSYNQDLSNGLENVPVRIDCSGVGKAEFPNFQYTPENVPGPGCSSDPTEITLPGCQCHTHSCQSEKCQCLQRYGPAYSDQQRLQGRRDAESGYSRPVFECNALCDCSEDCSNRVVQRGVVFRLRVFLSVDRGWGVRTMDAIPRGAFVCEYAGEVIGLEEARSRQLAQGPEDMNYIIAVREHAGQGNARETFVDPFSRGNVGRFINHSCQPNLFMVPVRVHSMVPRLALFAVRDIVPDEELTFDYSGRWNGLCLFENRMIKIVSANASANLLFDLPAIGSSPQLFSVSSCSTRECWDCHGGRMLFLSYDSCDLYALSQVSMATE